MVRAGSAPDDGVFKAAFHLARASYLRPGARRLDPQPAEPAQAPPARRHKGRFPGSGAEANAPVIVGAWVQEFPMSKGSSRLLPLDLRVPIGLCRPARPFRVSARRLEKA